MTQNTLQTTAERFQQLGGRLYLVGGAVRDRLMGRPVTDFDCCVVGLTEEQFSAAFPGAFLAGRDFPVFRMTLDDTVAEFALARTERKIAPGHSGFDIRADGAVSIEDDLSRRDFTINALALDVLTADLIDIHHGLADIQHATIRAVSDAFTEDPLRAYRAARFAAQLGFTIEPQTMNRIASLRAELLALSAERVFEELKKALRSAHPSRFFRSLAEAHVLDVHFPELASLIGVAQPVKYHPEGDAFEHTLQVLDAAAELSTRDEVRFSALVHDLGKGITPREQWPAHRGHEANGVPLVHDLCTRLKVPKQWAQAARFATAQHMKIHNLHGMKPQTVVELLCAAERNPLGVDGFSLIGLADIRGRNNPQATNLNAQQMVAMWMYAKATANGKTLQTEPGIMGAAFGAALRLEWAKAVQAWRQKL